MSGKIKKLYKNASERDDQNQHKAKIESTMVSTTEGCTKNILMKPNPYLSTKNPIARKSLRQFSETLDVKHKTSFHSLGAAKAKCKSIITGNVLWSNIANRRVHTKINQKFR